jgi:hypothetical protein
MAARQSQLVEKPAEPPQSQNDLQHDTRSKLSDDNADADQLECDAG